MTRVTRRVLEMSDRELDAVIAVAMPGRKVEGMRKDERQEICMKWLFANGLSINHLFTIDVEDDDIYVLMSNKSSCSCCQKENEIVSVKSFDSSAIGTGLAIFNKSQGDDIVQLQLPLSKDNHRSRSTGDFQQAKVHVRTMSDDNLLNSHPSTSSLPSIRRNQISTITTQPKSQEGNEPKSQQMKKGGQSTLSDQLESENRASFNIHMILKQLTLKIIAKLMIIF